MQHSPPLLALVPALLLALSGRPAAGDVSLFLGSPGGVGDVEVHDEEGILGVRAPAALQGIQLLPVDHIGRTAASALRTDRPRWRGDLPGASRLVLPAGHGSLYRYRRDDPSGGPSHFGYFLVDAGGTAASLWEHPGTGVDGTEDPLLVKVAVAADGARVLVATTRAAGGNLFELDLGTGLVHPRTEGLPAQEFRAHGLAILPDWGVGVSARGVFRFATATKGSAVLVPMPSDLPSDWIGGEVAASEDGSTVAFIAGASPLEARVFAVHAGGGVVAVGSTPAVLSGAGYLPEVIDGPHLALSTDGTICMWRTEEVLSRETFTGRVGATSVAAEQVTSDARFVDTLDHAGNILPLGLHSFALTVGERDDPILGGVENGDIYRVDVDPATGEATVTNLSLTSGDSTLPFAAGGTVSGEIAPRILPGAGWILAYRDTGSGGGDLLSVDATTGGAVVLRDAVRSVELAEVVGGDLVLGARRRVAQDTKELLHVPAQQPTGLVVLATLPAAMDFTRPAVSEDGWLGTVVVDALFELVARVQPASGAIEVLPAPPLVFGPAIGFTPRGDLALSVGAPGDPSLFVGWAKSGEVNVLPTGLRRGWILPRD